MMNKSFHDFLKGVSFLPALLVAPAMATNPGIGFVDGYVTETTNQLHSVLAKQNKDGFNIGKITIGTNMSSINGDSLRYNVDTRGDATQYVRVENAVMPTGFNDMYLNMPLYSTNAPYGLQPDQINVIKKILGNDVVNADGSVTPHVSDATKLLDDMIDANILHERTWILGALNSAIAKGQIENGYLYTNSGFVVDGNYGNMAGNLIETYRDAVVGILDELADVDNMTTDEIAHKMSVKLGRIVLTARDGRAPNDVFAALVGDQIFLGAFGISANDVAARWKSGELESALSTYLTQIKAGLADLNSLKMNVGEIAMNGGAVTFKNKVDLTSDNVMINGGTVTVDTGADLTLAGANLSVANGATLVNNGTFNVNSTNVVLNADLTGTGTLVVGENTTVDVENTNIEQGQITLNGNMSIFLRESEGARITADTIDGKGTINLLFDGEGTYNLFGNAVFANAVNPVYEINWIEEDANRNFTATLKNAGDIAKDNEISSDAAVTVVGLTTSASPLLNDLADRMTVKLAEGTPEARQEVEQATAAINPETESVTQSVVNSVQTTVINLASARMNGGTMGRSGGDFDMVANGVWAQGLYNKTKLNDSFNGYTRGVALGVDGTINRDITVGAGYAFNHSDIASFSRDTEIDSNTIFVYGQYKPDQWYVNAIMNYTWSEYTEDGVSMDVPVAGKYNADSFGMAVAAGYDFENGVTPELGLRYAYIDGDSYKNVAGTNKFDSTNYLTATLGARYGFDIVADDEMLFRPELRYAFKYDLISDESYATVAMPGTAAYTLSGDRLPRVGNEFGIGLTMKYRMMDLSLNYDIDVREDYTSQTGMLKFRYNF